MNSNTSSRLKSELGRSPKKAALLGLLLLVAMYYWMPLVFGWMKGGSPLLEPAVPAAAVIPRSTATPAVPAAMPAVAWQQIVKAMENDPHMALAATLVGDRDPFENVHRKVAEATATPEAKVQALVTPDTAGLILSSTVVGPRSRVAFVNGKTYRVGDIIHVTADGDDLTFAVVEIDAKQIVVEREKRRYVMKIKLGLTGNDFLGAQGPPAVEAAGTAAPTATQ